MELPKCFRPPDAAPGGGGVLASRRPPEFLRLRRRLQIALDERLLGASLRKEKPEAGAPKALLTNRRPPIVL